MEIVSKYTGSALTASEFNQIPDELENLISFSSQTPSSYDVTQVTKGIAQYVSDGDFYSTSGTADAIVLSAISPRLAPTTLTNGFKVRFKANYDNTSAVTINVNNLGAKGVTINGENLAGGKIKADRFYVLIYSSTSDTFEIYQSANDIEDRFLQRNQLTNCLLSVPNRINLTLDSGYVIAKAGSVVIFPYGTTDQSSTYTKGSSFGTGYTVYDTYWDSTNSKFFVYAQLINDITGTQSASNPCHIFLDTEGTMFIYYQSTSLSGTTPSSTCTFLNTTTNTILRYSSGTQTGNQYCLPLGRLIFDSNAPYRITNIYEGIGAMGSICWADKGISALLPKGRNEDGSLINEVITSENLLLLDCSAYPSDFDQAKQLFFSGSSIFFGNDNYNNASNLNYSTPKLVVTVDRVPIGRFYLTETGRVGAFYGYNSLNIGDYSDGRFNMGGYTIVSGSNVPTSSDATFDLSSYLPDDGREYEVMISGEVITGTTSGNGARLYITTHMLASNVYLCRARTTANGAVYACGACTIPVGLDRSIKVIAASGAVGTYYLHADGYRRMGING